MPFGANPTLFQNKFFVFCRIFLVLPHLWRQIVLVMVNLSVNFVFKSGNLFLQQIPFLFVAFKLHLFLSIIAKTKCAKFENETSKTSLFSLPFFSVRLLSA